MNEEWEWRVNEEWMKSEWRVNEEWMKSEWRVNEEWMKSEWGVNKEGYVDNHESYNTARSRFPLETAVNVLRGIHDGGDHVGYSLYVSLHDLCVCVRRRRYSSNQ